MTKLGKARLTTGEPPQTNTIMDAGPTIINHQKLETVFNTVIKGRCHQIMWEWAISRTLNSRLRGHHPVNPISKNNRPAGAIVMETTLTAANRQSDLSTRLKSRNRRFSYTIVQKFQKRRTLQSPPSNPTASATSLQVIQIYHQALNARNRLFPRTSTSTCKIWTPPWLEITTSQTLRPNWKSRGNPWSKPMM